MNSASACPPAADALAALRAATRERHQRVDRLVELRRLRDRAHYGRVLQALHAFLAPWEQAVAQALPAAAQAWLRQRSRLPFLKADLRTLALAPAAPAALDLRFTEPGAAWGSLYVVEGSALGGQVIARALRDAGLPPAHAYFEGWGRATAGMWQEFRARLQQELAAPPRAQAACEAACATFDALAQLLEEFVREPQEEPAR